jgi:hypothetical protein
LPRSGSRVRIPSPAPNKPTENRHQSLCFGDAVPASISLNEPRTVPTCAPQLGKRRAKRSRKVPDGPPQKRSPASAATKSKSHSCRGGRRSRDKGNRAERAIVRFLQERGFAAERIPLSGSAGGKFRGDVSIPLLSVDRVAEVKCRANGFRELYAWLDARDLLIVKADRREPLVVIPLKLAAEIAQAAERGNLLNPQFATSAAKRDTATPVPACDAKPCTERKSIQ